MGIVLVASLGVGAYLYTRMDDEIRQHVEYLLAENFPQLNVSVGGARLVHDRGIAIYDLSISETSASRRQNNLLVVDELMVVCDVQLSKLVKGDLKIRRVVVKHPQLWITRSADSSWNLRSLWPLPPCGNSRPLIDIQDALIVIADQSHPTTQPLVFRDVNMTIVPERSPQSPNHAQSTGSGAGDLPVAERAGSDHGMAFSIDGTLSGKHLKLVEIHAKVDTNSRQFSASGNIQQWELSRELQPWLALLAEAVAGQSEARTIPLLQGIVDGRFEVTHRTGEGGVPRFLANVRLSQGWLSDARIPRPLTDLSCTLQSNNTGLQIERLRARCGPASVSAALKRVGWSANAPLALALHVEHLPLDESLRAVLPPMLQAQWQKFLPAGQLDANVQATFDGKQWLPRATLTGRQLSFESDKFRYRLVDGSGTMKFTPRQAEKPARLDINMTGYGGGQPIEIVGQVFDPKPGAAAWIELSGRDLAIEQSMIDALPEKPQRVIASMHPTGKFHFRWRLDRPQPGMPKPQTTLRLELANCRVQYDHFPYPLREIQGLVLAENDRWTFRDLVSGGTRVVRCQGNLQPTATGTELNLQFSGEQIQLDEDLRLAVPESVKRAWAELRPRGRVDFVSDVRYQSGYSKPNISVTIRPRRETASIEPKFFPYLIEGLEGSLTYRQGQLTLSQMRGRHGRTTIRTNGSGYFDPQGGWEIHLEGLSADRVKASRDLVMAMPLKLRKLIDQLLANQAQPTGTFGLHDAVLSFSKTASPLAAVQSRWDFQLDCHQTDLQVGVDLTNVHGSVRLVGADDGKHAYSTGELAIDSATFLDVQFTDIRGPIWVDQSRCLLGRGACELQQKPPRRLTAKVYGGQLVADVGVTFDNLPRYGAKISLTTADLSRLVNERFGGQQDFKGTVSANLVLQGTGRSYHNLDGKGEVQIRDANIYELPLLVGLLKILRSRSPDTTAFNQCDMKFRLQGQHIYLDQINFLGDAVSLYGMGYTNFDQQLKMVFHGTLGRNDYRIPLLKNFVARANQSIMEMYVSGTLADPQIHTQAFPGINKLLQQIQSDINAPATAINPRQAKQRTPTAPGPGRQ